MLYVVATPIGNLKDMTFRAREILQTVDVIACEDTRHASILLNAHDIKKPLLSFHSHSGFMKVEKILDYLKNGRSVALISDAGTPGISDPGYVLIKRVIEEGFQVVPIPGPSAVITALSASGLPTDKFLYLGFLPVKKGRQTIFQKIAASEVTCVFYESPHRLLKTLKELAVHTGADRPMAVGKELTKIHETFFRGTAENVLAALSRQTVKGEYVVMVGPA